MRGLTEATTRNNLQVIRRFLAECPAEDITRENVLGYVNGFGKYRRLTAATYRNVLQRFFAFCSENEGLPMDIQEAAAKPYLTFSIFPARYSVPG